MLKTLSHRAKAFLLSQILLIVACSHSSSQSQNSIEIDKPLIQNLSTAHPQMQNLKHSLVRLRLGDDHNQSSFGTGFFFKSRDLLVTSLHTFDKHECLEKNQCELILGFAKSEKEVEEIKIEVKVALKDSQKDLLFFTVKTNDKMANIIPLQEPKTAPSKKIIAAGFYQDGTELTFSHGQRRQKHLNETVTTMIVGHGFSGAPVVNEKGEVIGVVSSYHPLQNHNEIGLARFVELN